MKRHWFLVLGAAFFLAVSCSRSDSTPAAWPEFEGAVVIDVSALKPASGALLDPHGVGLTQAQGRMLELLRVGEVLERLYPDATMFPGDSRTSVGVRVVYVEEDDQFFLQEDHMMGHYDNFIGPFLGDPREVLEAALP